MVTVRVFPMGDSTLGGGFKNAVRVARRKKVRANYNGYLGSEQWYRIRMKALIRAGFKCRRCGAKQDLMVHHKTYKHAGKERQSELIVLCRECHKLKHTNRIDQSKRLIRALDEEFRQMFK